MKPVTKLQDLLNQEVTRKEFLKYVGIAVLCLIGVTNMLQSLNSINSNSSSLSDKASGGYGGSAYGR
jgi:hypothetical protein